MAGGGIRVEEGVGVRADVGESLWAKGKEEKPPLFRVWKAIRERAREVAAVTNLRFVIE